MLVVDLSAVVGEAEQGRLLEEVAREAQASLNLESGPVWRVLLFECGAAEAQSLLVLAHHLVMDAVSWRILLGDVERGYEQSEQRSRGDLSARRRCRTNSGRRSWQSMRGAWR